MPIMLSKTYDAFKAAGAPDDKAREAAEELAGYENRFAKIEPDLAVVKADTTALKWMIVCQQPRPHPLALRSRLGAGFARSVSDACYGTVARDGRHTQVQKYPEIRMS